MRDQDVFELRPKLDLPNLESTEIEAFQNKTLRPILKLQQPITLSLLKQSEHFSKMLEKIDKSDQKALLEVITKYTNSNVVFKSKIIGCIIGMMTEEEMEIYKSDASEINKRITQMQIQRYFDSLKY